jgi:DNA anti-recombination protein RmuC
MDYAMSELTQAAPGQESKPVQETIGETLKPAKEETVPLSAHIELKKAHKAAERELKELRKTIESGATKTEVSASIDSIVEKYSDVDPAFLRDLSQALTQEAETKAEQRLAEKLKPLQEREEAARIESVFSEHFQKVVEENPEYKDVVNREVIKQLSLLPQNSNKTFSQLIEETYKHAVEGKRSIDSAQARVGKESDAKVDVQKAQRDPAYMKEVLASPELKKQYQEGLVSRVSRFL